MISSIPFVSQQLTRIEVLAAPTPEEYQEAGATWTVTALRRADALVIVGYLRRAGPEGYGQAQAAAVLREDSSFYSLPDDELTEYLSGYMTENLYDICRRALQSQAADMDFVLDVPLIAPLLEEIPISNDGNDFVEAVDTGLPASD